MTSTTHLNVITLTLVITYQLNQLNQITRLTGDPSIHEREIYFEIFNSQVQLKLM